MTNTSLASTRLAASIFSFVQFPAGREESSRYDAKHLDDGSELSSRSRRRPGCRRAEWSDWIDRGRRDRMIIRGHPSGEFRG